MITDQPFNSSGKIISKEAASYWFKKGLNKIPGEIKKLPFADSYDCNVLIYEFKKPESDDAYLLDPCNITADEHLERAKITTQLNRK